MWCWIESVVPPRDVPYLALLVTTCGFVLGLLTYWRTKKREAFKLGVDLILKLSERLDRADMQGFGREPV